MNAYAAAVFGTLVKVYDDMEDNPVLLQYNTPQFMELVKALVIVSFTYVSIHNINFPIIIFIVHYINYLFIDNHSLATDFYHAGMFIAFLLSIITFDVSKLSMALINTIIYGIIGIYIDHALFSEEHSWTKIIWRTLCSIGLVISLQFSLFMPYYDMILFSTGYFITSVCMMTYAQCNETKSSKEPTEPTEPNEPNEAEEPKEPNEAEEPEEPKEPNEAEEPKEAKEPEEPKEQISQEANPISEEKEVHLQVE